MLASARTSTCGMLRASAVCGSRLRAASSRLIHPAVRRMSVAAHNNHSEKFGDHSWRQQNHIWSEAEIAERMATADQKHVPQGLLEHVLQKMVRLSYHAFNAVTGYEHADPATSAIGYRCEDGRPAVYARPLVLLASRRAAPASSRVNAPKGRQRRTRAAGPPQRGSVRRRLRVRVRCTAVSSKRWGDWGRT